MALFIYPPSQVTISGVATEATLLDVLAEVTDINANTADAATATKQDEQTTELQTLNATDFATQTTLSNIDSKIVAIDTGAVTIVSSVLPTDAASETTLSAAASDINDLNARLAGSLVPEAFDYQSISYVGATTDIDTVVYKTGGSGGTTVATLTMGYDGSNRLTSVTRS